MLPIIVSTFRRLARPLRAIEYIVSIGVLWATVISVFFIASSADGDSDDASTSFSYLIERYEVTTIFLSVMAVLAVLDIVGLLHHKENSRSAFKIRAAATFGMTLGFFFVAALSLLSLGPGNILWVNEFTLAMISAVLYLNLKVNKENADR